MRRTPHCGYHRGETRFSFFHAILLMIPFT
jgi:hypothetical protein